MACGYCHAAFKQCLQFLLEVRLSRNEAGAGSMCDELTDVLVAPGRLDVENIADSACLFFDRAFIEMHESIHEFSIPNRLLSRRRCFAWSAVLVYDRHMTWLILIAIGLVAGLVSGLVGIGGGIIVAPALVILLGFSQKMAQGTTLALLVPPIGILAALSYYKQGYVSIYAAIFIIVGFVVGSVIGAKYLTGFSNEIVTRVFAVFLIAVAVKLLIGGK